MLLACCMCDAVEMQIHELKEVLSLSSCVRGL